MLKARNWYQERNGFLNDVFKKVSLEEVIEMQLRLNKDTKSQTGLYIETKNVEFYWERGVDIAQLLFEVLKKYDLETSEKASVKLPIIIESFESESLKDFWFKFNSSLPFV